MKRARTFAPFSALLWLTLALPPAADAAERNPSRPAIAAAPTQEIKFVRDDAEAHRIAERLLSKQIAELGSADGEPPILWTAWVQIAQAKSTALLVMYGCSPVGNCDLYGFERSNNGWRLILRSIAQRCSLLPSSHGGRRDLMASIHGSATESTIKTYWWRQNRYVRVAEREHTWALHP